MARVYISSTSIDLRVQRAAALDAVLRLGHQPVAMEYYGASEVAPLAKCVADVRSCDLYIAILGWRYGFIPPEGKGGRSITEHEYEAAGEAKIKRLVYLSTQSDAEWIGPKDENLQKIRAFRERVSGPQTPGYFKDQHQLAVEIAADVPLAIGLPSADLNHDYSLLPYFCDRTSQQESLVQTLVDSQSKIPVGFLDGPSEEVPERFVDCLKEALLCEWLGTRGPTQEFQVDWPRAQTLEDFQRRLPLNFAKACRIAPAAGRDAVERHIASLPVPALVTCSIPADTWEDHHGERLGCFLDFVDAWSAPRGPTLVLFWTSYRERRGGLVRWLGLDKDSKRKAALDEAFRRQLKRAHRRICLTRLDPLSPVQAHDALHWARSDRVQCRPRPHDLEIKVQELFAPAAHLPMITAAEKLRMALRHK